MAERCKKPARGDDVRPALIHHTRTYGVGGILVTREVAPVFACFNTACTAVVSVTAARFGGRHSCDTHESAFQQLANDALDRPADDDLISWLFTD